MRLVQDVTSALSFSFKWGFTDFGWFQLSLVVCLLCCPGRGSSIGSDPLCPCPPSRHYKRLSVDWKQ